MSNNDNDVRIYRIYRDYRGIVGFSYEQSCRKNPSGTDVTRAHHTRRVMTGACVGADPQPRGARLASLTSGSNVKQQQHDDDDLATTCADHGVGMADCDLRRGSSS